MNSEQNQGHFSKNSEGTQPLEGLRQAVGLLLLKSLQRKIGCQAKSSARIYESDTRMSG